MWRDDDAGLGDDDLLTVTRRPYGEAPRGVVSVPQDEFVLRREPGREAADAEENGRKRICDFIGNPDQRPRNDRFHIVPLQGTAGFRFERIGNQERPQNYAGAFLIFIMENNFLFEKVDNLLVSKPLQKIE